MIHHSITIALRLLPLKMDTQAARVMMLATGLQESRFKHRRQLVGNPPQPVGPAKGFWQFEKGGGCVGVLTHRASKALMIAACERSGVPATSAALWNAIENDDVLAATAARLLLYTDPAPLPIITDIDGAWDYYMRCWRPGKPHRATWDALHAQAVREEHEWWGA